MTGPDPRSPEGAPEPAAAPEAHEPLAAPVPPPEAATEPRADRDPAADLPPVDSIGPETDLAPWLKPGVPAALKNAALRRKWLSLPAIRDYVDPALDYAWDWNAAAPVPGAAGRIAQAAAERMVAVLTGPRAEAAPRPAAEQATNPAPAKARAEPAGAAASAPVESETTPAAPVATLAPVAPGSRRRHGGAAPLLAPGPQPVPPGGEGRSA